MKIRPLVFVVLASLILVSCKKKEEQNNNTGQNILVGEVPSFFSQKVLLEENTGEWCGWCPEGAHMVQNAINTDPERVVAVAIHDGDPMQVTDYNKWQMNKVSTPGFPSGSIQRGEAAGRISWHNQTTHALRAPAECGLAITSSLVDSFLSVDVYIGYQQAIQQNTRLTVLVLEDNVPQSSPGAQSNFSSFVVVDSTWKHQHVLRGALTKVEGNLIQLKDPNRKYVKQSFSGINLKKLFVSDMNNCKVVAFININDIPASSLNKKVLNVQSAKVNHVKKWD